MNLRAILVVAVVLFKSSWAWAGEIDSPRPDLWEKYPQIKQEVDKSLAALPGYLKSLEPEAFIAKHPALAKMAQSPDWAERMRALRAVAALEDPAGIPLLVAGIMDARDKDEAAQIEAMNPLTSWIAGRSPRDKFKPLAPLFLSILVSAKDWPNLRCQCLQGLGNLADRDWLPLIKELLASRHPAVTNMSAWIVQQVSSRPGPGDDTRPLGAAVPAGTFKPEFEFSSRLGEAERLAVVSKVKAAMKEPVPPADDRDEVFYSDDHGHFDSWIPISPNLRRERPDVKYLLTWRYRNGRVCSATVTEPNKQPWVEQRVWYDPQGAPICSVRYDEHGEHAPLYLYWADYGSDNMISRVVELNADFSVRRTWLFENGQKYSWTAIREFDGDGKLVSILRYTADGKLTYTEVAKDAPPRDCGAKWRIDSLCEPENFGLAPYYPIPPGPSRPEATDPPEAQLRIDSVAVKPAGVEEQCRAKVVISNGGVGYQTPPDVIGDSIMIRIYDSRGRLIFRAGHGWSGLRPGEPLKLNTDTHSNTLRFAGGKPFLFPKVGQYTLSITAVKGATGKWTDSRSVKFYVGKDESEFKVQE